MIWLLSRLRRHDERKDLLPSTRPEARRAEIAEEKHLSRIRNPRRIVEMLLSPEHDRYLNK